MKLKVFYTYAWLRKDGTPYYIGKGCGNRCYSNQGRGKTRPPRDKDRILLLKRNLTEEEAFRHECYMIAVFGRKDIGTGILRNRTNGGEGSSGHVPNRKSVERVREVQRSLKVGIYALTLEDRKRNGHKGGVHGKGGAKPKPVICVETGDMYSSASEASRLTGINRGHIGECCRGQRKSAGKKTWRFNPCQS